MMSKRIKRTLCALLAMLMALPGCAATETGNTESDSVLPETVLTDSEQDGTYFPYYDLYMQKPDLSDCIRLLAREATLSGDARREQTHLEETDTVCMEQGGSMSWQFRLEQEARFCVWVRYVSGAEILQDNAIALELDGESPFQEAEDLPLTRLWKDATEILQDELGNDRIPEQEQVLQWSETALQDYTIFSDRALIFYLPAGEHTITVRNRSAELHVASLELTAPEREPTDEDALAAWTAAGYGTTSGFYQKIQAENTAMKSTQSIYPTYDRASPATEPYDVYHTRRNTIGADNWSEPGTWVSYTVKDVPEDGLYYISLKYCQNQMIGTSTFRTIRVNGEIPSDSFRNVAFAYDVRWKIKTVSDSEGNLCPVYLKKGDNEIRIEATVGKWSEVLRIVEASNRRLNDMYIQIVMVTGTTPDQYYDYNLETEVPGLLECFARERDVLAAAADEFDRLNGGKTTQSETLRGAVNQLDSMCDNPKSIQKRLSNYRDTISTLSSWVYENMDQSLELDYLIVHSADVALPKAEAGFWAKLRHGIVTFFLSFILDYDTVGSTGDGDTAITVWINSGRDQASILMDMISESFTPETGISVRVSLVQSGFIEATLAGTGPDVAIGVARGQPVNLACRGALEDLSQFDTFDEVVSRFGQTATVPFEYNGGTYAVPNTQSFFVMFYRKDILSKLDLQLPETWDELLHLVPRLQKKHMEVGLPYSAISAAAAVDSGMGAKDLFPVLLLQNGGQFYADDGSASALSSEAAMSAFRQWCEYYQQYGFELVYDFYTRFRDGDMPIAIADLSYYNVLMASAPEIRGQWGIAPIPGTVQADGTIDRSTGSAGSGVVMFRDAENKQACWDFIEWWTRAETQQTYNEKVENVMGPAGRNPTANLEAFSLLPWSEEELETLTQQRSYVRDLPEVPGSYFVTRCLDNAFRAVLYDGDNPREVFEQEVQSIDREIQRKRKELGLDG